MLCETEIISEVCLQEAIAEDTERRRLHRKPFLRKATIVIPELANEPAFCRDISSDGIGLLHEFPMEPGCEFILAIPIIGSQLDIHCKANWCRQVGDRQYFSGCAHHFVTTPQSLVLMSAALSENLNRRLYQRYPFIRPVTLEYAHGGKQSVFCRDISRQGIGLIHREPIVPGRVALSIASSDRGEIAASADLRRCVSIGQGWYASGGRFPAADPEE